ncbi:MAG: response regulator [Phycisphaerae bacterium]
MVAWSNAIPDTTPSVLIADDSAAWRDAVGEVLAREGFRTLEAADGAEAVEVVRCERLDVVLLDFHMPRLDGLQALRIIRREHRRLPSVLMTARPMDVPPEAVRALRIATVLAKPADRRVIVTTVTPVIEGYGEDGDDQTTMMDKE